MKQYFAFSCHRLKIDNSHIIDNGADIVKVGRWGSFLIYYKSFSSYIEIDYVRQVTKKMRQNINNKYCIGVIKQYTYNILIQQSNKYCIGVITGRTSLEPSRFHCVIAFLELPVHLHKRSKRRVVSLIFFYSYNENFFFYCYLKSTYLYVGNVFHLNYHIFK